MPFGLAMSTTPAAIHETALVLQGGLGAGWSSRRRIACGSTMLSVPKALLIVTALAVLAGGAILFDVWRGVPREARPVIGTEANPSPEHRTVGLAESRGLDRSLKADTTPTFDIVRIEPGGDAVIAGRSAPGVTVQLLRDGVIQDKATTDAYGHFVLVPPRFPPGRHELSLVAMQPDGKEVTSQRSVSVAVPPSQAE
jgi:hypothetical protein